MSWLVPVIIVGSVVLFLFFIRFIFIRRRIKRSSHELAVSNKPLTFGTIDPLALKQKIHIKRIREHPPVVLTPGSRLGSSIRIPKMSFNFTTLLSKFRIELDELDALEDVEAQYEDVEEEVAAQPPKPRDIAAVWWRSLCPCIKSKYKIGVIDDNEYDEGDLDDGLGDDDQSVEPKSSWVIIMNNNANEDLNSVDSAAVQVIDSSTGKLTNEAILKKKMRNKDRKKYKRKKKPAKLLTKREQVEMFLRHMRQKKLRKKKLRLGLSVSGSADELNSLDMGSSLNSSMSEVAGPLAENPELVMNEGDPWIENSKQQVNFRESSGIMEGEYTADLGGDGETVPQTEDLEAPHEYLESSFDSRFDNPTESVLQRLCSPQSGLAGMTIGYHTTVSNEGGSNFFASQGLLGADPSSNGLHDWDSSIVRLNTSGPVINAACAQYRKKVRTERKNWALQTMGMRDTVAVNGGPPAELIPPGYEISGALLTMEHHNIAYKRVMYLFDHERDIAKGWFFGTLIGLSMIRPGNYHIRFEEHETKHRKVHGIYKLDLSLEGENAYGRRWVILTPSLQLTASID